MRILISSDHRGFDFKNYLVNILSEKYQVLDLGPTNSDSVDYPDYAHKLCNQMQPNDFGILICGSGIGMSITANRHPNIRAALCRTQEDAHSTREHNNANILVLGANLLEKEQATKITTKFLETNFAGGRHQKRIEKINLNNGV